MRLAAKLILLYLIGLLLIVGVFSYLTAGNNRRLVAAQHGRRAAELVAMMRPNIVDALRDGGIHSLEDLLAQRSREIRHLEIRYVSPAQAAKSDSGTKTLLRRRITTFIRPTSGGDQQLVTTVPLSMDNPSVGAIEVASDDEESKQRIEQSLHQSAIALASVTGLSAIVIFLGGVFMVGRPLQELTEKVERIGKGDFSNPVQLSGRDELGKLGNAMNQMCDSLVEQREQIQKETQARLQTVNQLRHADRLGTVGRMAAGVAHEVGTPLAVVSGRAELIKNGDIDEDSVHESAAIIKSECDRIAGIVRQLLGFARGGEGDSNEVCIHELVSETIEMMGPLIEKNQVQVNQNFVENAKIKANRSQLQQVVTNLLNNSIDAGCGHVDIEVRRIHALESESGERMEAVEIYFGDDGIGIEPGALERIFDPFFTTKDVGHGTGLGLSIAYGIVRDHKGLIKVDSQTRAPSGTTFRVILPVHSDCIA